MSLSEYIKLNTLGGDFADLYFNVREGVPSSAFGVQFSQKCHIASFLDSPTLYITSTAVGGRQTAEEMAELSGKKVVFLGSKDDVLLYKKSFNKDSLYSRLTALYEITQGADIVVSTFEGLLQLFPSKILSLKVEENKEYRLSDLSAMLVRMGYRREQDVSDKGSFSIRGDILDVYPINCEEPFRVDFFGDDVECIHTFDLANGRKKEKVKDFTLVMATDIIIDDGERKALCSEIEKSYRKAVKNVVFTKSRTIYSDLIAAIEGGGVSDCLQFIMPLIKNVTSNIFNFLPDDTIVVFDECKLLKENLEMLNKEHFDRVAHFTRCGEAYDFTVRQFADGETLLKQLNAKRRLALQSLTTTISFFNPLKTYKFNCTPVPRYSMRVGDAVTDISNWKRGGYTVIACCASMERAQKLYSELYDKRVTAEISDTFNLPISGVKLTSFILSSGFIYHDAKLVVIGSGDMYLKSSSEKKLRRRRNEMFNAPDVGDYCVHEQHGVGIVRGTKKIETTSGVKDYISVEYAGGDVLYVSVEQMDKLTKYLAGEKKPTLNRIGGRDFERVKERVRESISKMAINLKELYRERAERRGFRFSPDDDLVNLFENSFEFDETEDQLSSIAEIKKDMESDKVMDRLLCGDVGFGKTEVALRAAFKAIADGKQVALIAPTTILSQQHYSTCLRRFEGMGIRVEVINRFKTPYMQKKILERLSKGEIDIIIGTHRLFGKDVKFNDLGLLILDEEQRFGVEHKEKIKTLKVNVDTLTLSATPIPRTLHMSLTGIRDISTINTPPKARIPVQTYVIEESEALIRDAVLRELGRGGQVFILYNRVETISKFTCDLATLLPEANIITAHGQMDERSLEEAIMQFYSGQANVLVATTIIENGIDMPNANTLIVIDADRLGLSTLYQLKGRVGRGNKLAHAYFTFKPDKVMSEAAYKRLNAIMEFTDMGSGFRIAMRDLEIRGAGNVLGREQHGHMERVGYELYAKILKEQLGEEVKDFDTELDIRISAFIPDSYIQSGGARMDCYKQIAEISTAEDRHRVMSSMQDVFGKPPAEVVTLVKIAVLKTLAKKVKATKVTVKKGGGEIVLADINALNNQKLYDSLTQNKKNVSLSFKEVPVITINLDGASADDALNFTVGFLDFEGILAD